MAALSVRILVHEKRFEEAVEIIKTALEKDNDNAGLLFALGDVMKRANDIHEAVFCWEKVVQLDPEHLDTHFNLGLAYSQRMEGLWNLPEAVEHFKTVLKIEPDNSEAHANLASLYLRQNKLEAAINELEHTLKLNPDYVAMEYIRAEVYHRRKEFDKGIEYLKKAISSNRITGRPF